MSKRVLVAPLDWGLGHATRCIPIIWELERQGAEVILASNGRAYDLLRLEFPNLPLEKLPAYNIQYHSNNMFWNIARQLPKIIWAIWQEHWHLQKLLRKYQINRVISDNRYGCFSSKAKSVFVTHQLNIQIPNLLLQRLVRFVHQRWIQQFDACWIPDMDGADNLAGNLTWSKSLQNITRIGILSRMRPWDLPLKWDILVVLSGPEPQRTVLEQLIINQVKDLPYKILLVQGKPEKNKVWKDEKTGTIEIVPFLKTQELNKEMAASSVIICRSGYSTLMDLAILGKKAILIPTPGQTEQEYLAERLFKKEIFYTQQQADLNIQEALKKVSFFGGLESKIYHFSSEKLRVVIACFLSK